jgi:hypothetical protein
VELTLDAASSATDANCTSIRAYRAHFDKLRVAAEKAFGLFEALDTTSASDLVLAPQAFGQIRPSLRVGDVNTVVRSRLARVQLRIDLTLAGLNRQKGPDRRLSLRWLVERLGDLWFNETGEIVTSNAIKGGDSELCPTPRG